MKVILLLLVLMSMAYGHTIVQTFDAPDTNITGLAWGDGKLWAVDETTDYVYSVNPTTGATESSFYVAHSAAYYPTGLAYSETHTMLLVGLWNSSTTGYVYKYTPTGTFSGSVDMCGG